jgi:hypothetical protein
VNIHERRRWDGRLLVLRRIARKYDPAVNDNFDLHEIIDVLREQLLRVDRRGSGRASS